MKVAHNFDFKGYVDVDNGVVDRTIFSDQSIYETELERIFARSWNFMCHESQIPKPGDFFLSFIGEESVIATRDKKGQLQVLLNSCRHRGNAVCRAEQGNARSFLCTYHGWTYGLDGSLIGVPGYKDFYHEQLDKSQWGLVKAGKVASYKGFVFATMDPEAPDLEEFLGPVGRMGMDILTTRGDIMIVEGVQKNLIHCNWKLAVDNLFDYYHVGISHASAMMSNFSRVDEKKVVAPLDPMNHKVILGDYGHALGGHRLRPDQLALMQPDPNIEASMHDHSWRNRPGVAEALGPVAIEFRGHPNVFPNLWISGGQLCLRLPRGPFSTEIWWFTFMDTSLSDEGRAKRVQSANHVFGPAGMLEQEDGENWDQSTRAMRGPIARRYPLNFQMGLGHGEIKRAGDVSYIDTPINEHAQLWLYRAWADWMSAASWADLKRDATRPPVDGVV
ncbi:aromatic ring-hydroxylating oxygenase subunit alpha [Phenylobacterium immobile]|uniref:aromatic ring-hydroxylating oxygenase subunit alpha n=1 Tax=Phenylobacterium immobile TaxID=21 RepID=UPI000A6EA0B5|nr:SRPBCC family protein [Phenylobacterium immobile]